MVAVVDTHEYRPPRGFVWTLPAVVDEIIDGDSVRCHVWFRSEFPEHQDIRVDGIDALEKSERYGGEAIAKARELLPAGTPVTLVHRKRDKYGRLLARIVMPDGRDYGEQMMTTTASDGQTPLAKPYIL